jgi:hypothetical protein
MNIDIVTLLRKEISKRDRPYPVELLPELKEAADEIERLRAELARYKRMYCRMACRDLYASGVKWKTKPNKMRDDGVFIEEDCEPGKNRTWAAFPIQFAHDDAAQIVELLNRAADELAREAK